MGTKCAPFNGAHMGNAILYVSSASVICSSTKAMSVQHNTASLPSMTLTLGGKAVVRNSRSQKPVNRNQTEKEVCTRFSSLTPVSGHAISGSVSTCHSVWLSSGLFACISQKRHVQSYKIFYTCYLWLWLGPLLTTAQYVIYFRFCEWRHVFTLWCIYSGSAEVERPVTPAWAISIHLQMATNDFIGWRGGRHMGWSLPSPTTLFWLHISLRTKSSLA